MTLCLALATGALCATACPPEPLDGLTLAAVLRDSHHFVTGAFPSPQRLAVAWAQVRLEGGAAPRCRNLGSIGASGDAAFYVVGGFRFRVAVDYIDGGAAYWRAVCHSALRRFDAGDAWGAGMQLARCGYHRSDPERYAGAMVELAASARAKVLPRL